jgi:hypothetical protein
MMMNRALLAAFLALGSICPSAAWAQSKPKPQDPIEAEAVRHFDKGNEYTEAGKFAEAEREFSQAWALKPTFDVAANLGDCEVELKHYRQAAEHIAYALRSFPIVGKPQAKQRLQDLFETVRPFVGKLTIHSMVPGAEVVLDGHSLGTAPLAPVFVDPGKHTISARLADYNTFETTLTVLGGKDADVSLTPTKKAQGGEPSSGIGIGWAIGSGVASAVGLGLGIGLTVASNSKASERQTIFDRMGSQACPPTGGSVDCSALYDAESSRAALSNGARAAFVGAGLFGVGAAVLALANSSSSKTSSSTALSVSLGGVAIKGAW